MLADPIIDDPMKKAKAATELAITLRTCFILHSVHEEVYANIMAYTTFNHMLLVA